MAGFRVGHITIAWVLLGVTAVLLTLGVLWPLLALGPGGPPSADAQQAVAADNQFALPAGLISQTRFPPTHPGAVNPSSGVEGDPRDNLLVLALSSSAFLFLASLSLLLRCKVRHLGKPGQPRRANLVDRGLPVAPSVVSSLP